MNTYKLTVREVRRGYQPPPWLVALKAIDRDSEVADVDDDGTIVTLEIQTDKDISSLAKVKDVVSLERTA